MLSQCHLYFSVGESSCEIVALMVFFFMIYGHKKT